MVKKSLKYNVEIQRWVETKDDAENGLGPSRTGGPRSEM